MTRQYSTVDQVELDKFARLAEEWWDEQGKFKTLHQFNPVRLTCLRKQIVTHFKLDTTSAAPFKGLKILDIGCGGGLLCEPLARLGAEITGIDAAEQNIKTARLHAQKSGLPINYQVKTIEEMAEGQEKFDIVLAMEIIEHVLCPEAFISFAATTLKAEGLFFIATLNRTAKSYLLAIAIAEYLLNWLEKGTHSWNKFLKPSEIYRLASQNHLELIASNGFSYNPLKSSWQITSDLAVNYMMSFRKLEKLPKL